MSLAGPRGLWALTIFGGITWLGLWRLSSSSGPLDIGAGAHPSPVRRKLEGDLALNSATGLPQAKVQPLSSTSPGSGSSSSKGVRKGGKFHRHFSQYGNFSQFKMLHRPKQKPKPQSLGSAFSRSNIGSRSRIGGAGSADSNSSSAIAVQSGERGGAPLDRPAAAAEAESSAASDGVAAIGGGGPAVGDVPEGAPLDSNDFDPMMPASLERARHLGSPYFQSYKEAVESGLAKELMRNPFPDSIGSGLGDEIAEAEVEQDVENAEQEVEFDTVAEQGENCTFKQNIDYIGEEQGPIEHLTKKACCALCESKNRATPGACVVAVMSATWDEPPEACWLKRNVQKSVKKAGVTACVPSGADPFA